MNLNCREARLPFDLTSLGAAIPELGELDSREIERRTSGGYLLLLAEADSRVAGFKLGYPLDDTIFYSWIGGILPEFRRHGLARSLLRQQEMLVRQRGQTILRVKSMNKFPAMLCLLISEGYQITGLEGAKIVFQKAL